MNENKEKKSGQSCCGVFLFKTVKFLCAIPNRNVFDTKRHDALEKQTFLRTFPKTCDFF